MIKNASFTVLTERYNQCVVITDRIERAVAESGVRNGMATVVSRHTTAGIAVNEALECLESDLTDFLTGLAPEDGEYAHARMLRDYGSTAGNPTGHLKAHITGNHCHLLIADGVLVRGSAQEVYLFEFDGPARRTVDIQIMGE